METIGRDLQEMQRTPLSASHVEALRAAGALREYPAGVFLAKPGEPADRFIYVIDGEIEVVNPLTDERHLPYTLGPAQFMGEIAFLDGGNWTMLLRTSRLPIQGLAQLEGAGVYYAATENEARSCHDGAVVVIGGGNSAGQAAMYLSRSARHVTLLVRGRSLAASMSSYLSSRLEADPAITIEYGAEVVSLEGEVRLQRVTVRNAEDGAERSVDACSLFIMVGAAPNTDWLSDLVQLDDKGFVVTGEAAHGASSFATSCPGIFAVGDVRARSVKRVASSVGEGSVVISQVWDYLNPNIGR